MSDDTKNAAGAPSPPAQSNTESQPQNNPGTEVEKSREETLKQARTFLQDEAVQKFTPQERVEFLKSKGVSENDIQDLLKEAAAQAAEPAALPTPAVPSAPERTIQDEPIDFSTALVHKDARPPIVTYPEFLTKPTRPPPLMSVNGFLNTVYAFTGISTLVYGTSKFVLEPMVAQLTEARGELHDTTKQDLTKLVSKLESTVSVVPAYKTKEHLTVHHGEDGNDDAVSQYDDPTELFHRDVGVQTSPIDFSFRSSPSPQAETATEYQNRRLSSLVSSLRDVHEGLEDQSDSYADVKTVLNVFNDDLDKMSAAHMTDFVGGYTLYGASGRNEPNDEIKNAKDNIRRIKGVLLSTRSFPTGNGAAR